jgi:hypothetical protein
VALTTVSAVQQYTGIADTEKALLEILLPAVETAVKKFIDRDIESQSYVDWYGGNNTTILLLNEYPVTSLTEIREDSTGFFGSVAGSFGTETILVSGIDYALIKDGRNQLAEVGRVMRINGVWPGRYEYKRGLLTTALKPGIGNIKVTYTAGYAANAIPKDIQLACWQLCARLRQMRKSGQLYASESLAEYAYNLHQLVLDKLIVGDVAQLLSRYRRVRDRHKVLS